MTRLFVSKLLMLSLGAALLAGQAMAQSAPVGTMWLTAGDQDHLFEISGGVVSTFSLNSNEYGLAVYGTGDVRTQANSSGNGYQYLNGTPTGTSYSTLVNSIYDGTQDAVHGVNYGIGWPTGGVYSYDQNWNNATLLFNPQGSDGLGIAYSSSSNSLYCLDRSGATVSQYSLGGTLLSQFSITNGCAGLAMDTDGTLWTLQQGTNGNLFHYTTNGTFLGNFSMGVTDNILGMEIGAVPEPTTLAALGLGAIALIRRRRK